MQDVRFDSITKRISNLCQGLDDQFIDPVLVTQKAGAQEAAEQCDARS